MSDEILPVFREAIAVHLILMGGAGIPPADIFVSPHALAPDGVTTHQLAVSVRQGDFVFNVTVGPVGMSDEDFYDKWPKAIQTLHSMSIEEAHELRRNTKINAMASSILAGLKVKRLLHAQAMKRPRA